ncbi:MAG: hypothetical protein AAF367_02805 [Pseudomonadota bacterium]
MRKTAGVLAAVIVAFGIGSVSHAAECEVEYRIQDGDTLSKIATLAYGSSSYDLIFLRNPSLAGQLADLPVGDTIIIPCLPGDDGLVPDAEALTAAMAAGEAAEAAAEVPVAEEPELASVEEQPATAEETDGPRPAKRVRLLTAHDLPPYSGDDLREGGMVTELLRLAFLKQGIDNYQSTVINDRDSHLQDLLIEGSFSIGYPWFRPPCEEIEALRALDPAKAAMCTDFAFSEPFHEYVNGFFTRVGEYSDTRSEFIDFAEARLCRPQGEDLSDLEVNGIVAGEATIARPETMRGCVEMLVIGEVDAISGEVFAVEQAINALGVADRVEELPNLSLLWTVHAVAPRSKPDAVALLDEINAGLIELKISGEWFSVVGRHLATP